MRLPPIKKLIIEDYPSQKSWIDRLIYPLNQFMTAISSGLQNGLTFEENITSQVYTVEFNNNTAEFPILFTFKFQSKPFGLFIVNIQDVTRIPLPFASAVFPTWTFLDQTRQIRISAISGLVANQRYSLTVIAL